MNAHRLFIISIIIKFLEGLSESLIGIFLYLFPGQQLYSFFNYFVTIELSEDANDPVAIYLKQAIQGFTDSSQHFLVFYLLSHGIIKIVLIYFLFKKLYWAYPVAIIAFSLFTVYQTYLYLQQHSLWMLVFIGLDVMVVWLTTLEYRHILHLKKNE